MRVRILHLEDDPLDAEMVRCKLAADGQACDFVLVEDRDRFEAALAEETFDIVLCDYNLRSWDGLSALKVARERQPDARVILVSGTLDEEEAVKSLHIGASDYVLKQRLDRLGPAVRRALAEAGEHRKRMASEKELRDSEKQFRQLVENIHDALLRDDTSGKVTFANDQFLALFGFEREQLRHLVLEDYVAPEWREALRDRHDRRVRGEAVPARFEYEGLRVDGARLWLEVDVVPLVDETGRVSGTQSAIRDITGRRQAEEALREANARLEERVRERTAQLEASEARLRYLLSSGPAVIYSCRPDGDFGATWISPNVSAQMGYPPDDFLKETGFWMSRVHSDDVSRIFADMPRLFERERHEHEYRFLRKDGEWRWMRDEMALVRDETGVPCEIVGVSLDITDRKRAEEAVAFQSELHRVAAEISTALVAMPAGRLDDTVDDALQKLGELFCVDRSYLFRLSGDHSTLSNTNEWCAPGIEPQIDTAQDVPRDNVPYSMGRFSRGEPLHIPDVDALPAEAAPDQSEFRRQGIQSLIRLPIARRNALLGFFGFDSVTRKRTWTEGEVSLLRIVADAFAGAFLRERDEAALRDANARLEQRVAERTAELEATNDRLRLSEFSVERASVAVFWVNKDGRIQRVNQAACAQTGYTQQELIRMRVHDLSPGFADAWDGHWQQLRPDRTVRFENTLQRKDGRFYHVEVEANWFELGGEEWNFAFVRDITERRQTEETRELQSTALNAAANAIVIADGAGVIEWVNPAFSSLTGYAASEVIGNTPRLLKSGAHDAAFYESLWRTILSGEVWQGEIINRYKDGSLHTEYQTITPVIDESGVVVRFVAIKEDVTERKRTEEMLLQAQKMEAIGQLAGGIAHDFNNILSVITIFGELALRQLESEHAARARVGEMMKAGERAADLTRQLLAFSRKQVIQPRLLDLNEIVAGTHKMLTRLIGEDIDLFLRLDRELGTIRADPGQVEQVILNLAVNARDAMPKGGSLTLETTNADRGEEYATASPHIESGRYVLLAVSDTGIGMDEPTRRRIFEPFFTTKAEGRGTGLGLATVYGIMKQNGGSIQVYSEPGRGTTFRVYFPRVDQPAEASRPAAFSMMTRLGHETILLVEDNEPLRAVLRVALETHGYTVLQAANGEEGLAVAQACERTIDLLLTDVVMPKLGGGDLAKLLSSLIPGIRVLYMSGYTEGAISQQGVLKEGLVLLEKPFNGNRLLRAVREELDRPREG